MQTNLSFDELKTMKWPPLTGQEEFDRIVTDYEFKRGFERA